MTSKIQIVNNALKSTGNAIVNVAYDGSDEWDVASAGFDRAIDWMLARHPWVFAKTTADLVQVAENPSKRKKYAYAFPTNMLSLRAVFAGGNQIDEYDSFEIINARLCLDYSSDVSVEYIREPPEDKWEVGFIESLTLKTEVYCLRGLNEDYVEARDRDSLAEATLLEARSQTDQQVPRRKGYRSSLAKARKVRRG